MFKYFSFSASYLTNLHTPQLVKQTSQLRPHNQHAVDISNITAIYHLSKQLQGHNRDSYLCDNSVVAVYASPLLPIWLIAFESCLHSPCPFTKYRNHQSTYPPSPPSLQTPDTSQLLGKYLWRCFSRAGKRNVLTTSLHFQDQYLLTLVLRLQNSLYLLRSAV